MSTTTHEAFLENLRQSKLLADDQWETVSQRTGDTNSVVESLIDGGLITTWQANQLLAGNASFLLEQGRYILIDQIGKGGMGVVYRARHTRMNRDVALKIVDPGRAMNDQRIARFRREIDVCSQLQHEHIVQAYDVGEDDGTMFLVLEYIEGLSLAELVSRDGPFDPADAAAIGMQTAAGLAYAHKQGIIHRDIKPSNILLSAGGTTKILDMGLARIIDETEAEARTGLTVDGAVMGSIDFMAPEQAKDVHAADARCDIYSLGATLYYVLSGRKPFPGGTAIEKLHRLANETPPSLQELRPDCPHDLVTVVERAMQKHEAARYQSAEEMVRVLQPFAAKKIAGRHAATAAVQAAADTHSGPPDEATVEYQPDGPLDAESSAAISLSRRKSSSSPAMGKILAAAILLALVTAFGIWQLAQNQPQSTTTNPPPDPAADQTTPFAAPIDNDQPLAARVEFPGHYGGIWSIAWSPDGRYLATGGGEGDVRVWDPLQGLVLSKYHQQFGCIYALAWSPDGKYIASGDANGGIHVWAAFSKTPVAKLQRNRLDNRIESNKAMREAVEFGGPTIAFSPDGKEIAYGNARKVIRYNLTEDKVVSELPGYGGFVEYSPSGKLLLGGNNLGDVTVWDVATGKALFRLPTSERIFCHAHLLDDERALIVHKDRIETWNLSTADLDQTWRVGGEGRKPVVMRHDFDIPPVMLSADRNQCLIANDAGIQQIDLKTGDSVFHDIEVFRRASLSHLQFFRWAVSPDLTLCVASWYNSSPGFILALSQVGDGRTLRRFGVSQPAELRSYPKIHAGRYAQPIDHYDRGMDRSRCWDLSTGKLVRDFPTWAHIDSAGRLRGLNVGRIERHPLPGQTEINRTEFVQLEAVDEFNFDDKFGAGIDRFHWTADGNAIWTTSDDFHRLFFWDATNGELLRNTDLGQMAFHSAGWSAEHLISQDGAVVACRNPPVANNEMVVGHGLSDEPASTIQTPLRSGSTAAALSPDGTMLVTDSGLGAVEEFLLWDVATGRRMASATTGLAHGYQHLMLKFSKSGRFVTAPPRIWEIQNQQLKQVWECPEPAQFQSPQTNILCRHMAMFDDDRHILVQQDAQWQIWNWRTNRKRATLFFMPADHWAFVNHETGHWNSSSGAYQYLRLRHVGKENKVEWLTPLKYQQQTGHENNPDLAGLDLSVDSAAESSE